MHSCNSIHPTVDYAYYEKKNCDRHTRKCIDGSLTGSGKCVGYCQYSGHEGYLTKEHRKVHNCLGKGCYYYIPKIKKSSTPKMHNQRSQDVFDTASQIVSGLEGIRIMRTEQLRDNTWTVKYITITNDHPIAKIEHEISSAIGQSAVLVKLDYDFDTAAHLVFSM